MTKQTEAQREARRKYRKESTHTLIIYYPNAEYALIDAYCKHINSPVATWVRRIVRDAIASDPTFIYNPEEEENQNDNSSL